MSIIIPLFVRKYSNESGAAVPNAREMNTSRGNSGEGFEVNKTRKVKAVTIGGLLPRETNFASPIFLSADLDNS